MSVELLVLWLEVPGLSGATMRAWWRRSRVLPSKGLAEAGQGLTKALASVRGASMGWGSSRPKAEGASSRWALTGWGPSKASAKGSSQVLPAVRCCLYQLA